MIPRSDPATGYLPPGVYHADWCEVADCFAGNSHRAHLTGGLLAACRNLAGAGCGELLLDGSFVTEKALPGDYDGAWEPVGVNPDLLDPVLLDFADRRAAMKAKYFGDLFPASFFAAPGVAYRDFFKTDRNGIEKGMCARLNRRTCRQGGVGATSWAWEPQVLLQGERRNSVHQGIGHQKLEDNRKLQVRHSS